MGESSRVSRHYSKHIGQSPRMYVEYRPAQGGLEAIHVETKLDLGEKSRVGFGRGVEIEPGG